MAKRLVLNGLLRFFSVVVCTAILIGVQIKFCQGAATVYDGDTIKVTIKGLVPVGFPVPYGTNVKGVCFDGYPQIVKEEGSKPVYKVKVEKNIMVAMRDGVKLAVDVYRPDAEGKFPALLAMGWQGKDLQQAVRWTREHPQPYFDTPFWDGMQEGGDIDYFVPRGFVHVIPEPRNRGNSEGYGTVRFPAQDTYDIIEWIAKQPWCTSKVGMVGPSSYSITQTDVAKDPPPHLVALFPIEGGDGSDFFHGIYDTIGFAIGTGRHGNDSGHPPDNKRVPPRMLSLPKDELDSLLTKAIDDPDIKYNSKFYSLLQYPLRQPMIFDSLLAAYGGIAPKPIKSTTHLIKLPTYLGTPWITRLYIWRCFESFEKQGTPKANKKLIVCPPGFPRRPWVDYHDENVRWYDYWLKGIDTGIMDEPPIKLFVMGINKWRFEDEWPLMRTWWTKFYLQPGGGLSTKPIEGTPEPDTFTQQAPIIDPTVYCLTYTTDRIDHDIEVTGPFALYLDASIDIDDTNWMADLVDVDPEGGKMLLSQGYLKAKYRAIDQTKSRPYLPVHLRQAPVPVNPGDVVEYAICMMPTANVFKKGHRIQLIVRNQDDLLSKFGTWSGVYMMPFQRTVTHNIHFGKSYLLLPIVADGR